MNHVIESKQNKWLINLVIPTINYIDCFINRHCYIKMSYVKISKKKKIIEEKHLHLLATMHLLSNCCMLSDDRTQITD